MVYTPPRRSDGTIQHYREKEPWAEGKDFRILSIDGGGICGILPASILAELERRYLGGRSIAAHFDLIAGTSTGGIIALALAHGLRAAEIQQVYVERGTNIFPEVRGLARLFRWVRGGVRYIYEPDALRDELLRIFGDTVLGDVDARLCIPAFEGRHGEPWIYKTPHHPDFTKDRTQRLVDVGMATASAPTFFASEQRDGYVMLDGGLWANNPVMNAVVDALSCFDIQSRRIRVLSLGCGETVFKVTPQQMKGGLWQWRYMMKAALRAQSHNALGQAGLLIGRDRLLRLDAPQSPNPIEMDDVKRAVAELPDQARSLVEGRERRSTSAFRDL